MRALLISILTIYSLLTGTAAARNAAEAHLPVAGLIAPNGRAVELSWFEATPPRVGAVRINRRRLGETGGATWKPVTPPLGPVMRFTDETIQSGVAYEYQVLRQAQDIVDVGYWTAGVDLPTRPDRGTAYMVIEAQAAEALAPRLARFERDLIGDGWQVQRLVTPRHASDKPQDTLEAALRIKNWLAEHYHDDPFGDHAAILIGRVPLVFSGDANPDGHTRSAHPTDLFYADMDGTWSATPDLDLLNNRVPSDFIEIQVGRIDFAPVSRGQRARELDLLRAYFDKNHHWRMGLHGDLRDAYGQSGHLTGELSGLRNIVGPAALRTGGHHDAGEAKPWLWGVDFGDYNGKVYAEKYANKAIFVINFGSGKQRIDLGDNALVASLAQPWYTVAAGWGGRPTWWLHHMALGGTIGDVHMRTVNNGRAAEPYRDSMDYFPTGSYLWRNPIWVNLLGDPTLHAFPLAPPQEVIATRQTGRTTLSWQASPDPDTLGYRIFRAPQPGKAFEDVTGPEVVRDLTFVDTDPPEEAVYMVRAYGFKEVHAGSFFTYSQGAFEVKTSVSETDMADIITLNTPVGQPVTLPRSFNEVEQGRIHAFIAGPAQGQLNVRDGAWVYTPPAGFAGTVDLRFSISDAISTREGVLRIAIGQG